MIIRKLEKDDLSQLAKLYQQFWGDRSNIVEMEKQFDLIQAENNHIILVCEVDGKVVGSVMGVVCRELYGDCRPFLVIENMIVDKPYRRNGVAHQLLYELEKLAEQRNCTQMILVTEKERFDACKFYEKYGFSKNTTGYKKKVSC